MTSERRNLIWIEPPLAAGGMAEVWRVITSGAEGVKNISIVKRILLSYASNIEFKKMFIDEAKITSQLHKPTPHPNIIQILEFQQFEDEYLLFLEYVNGADVRKILTKCGKQKIRFPIVFTLHIITEVLNGLYHSHNITDSNGGNLNIIHRDISPQNIMVSYGGDVKILDWGIADAKMKSTETVVGIIKGKYGYMSPEQANAEKLDYKTDIYSASIVLWEMLTGRRLFVHENDLKTLKRIQKAEIPDPRKYNSDISENLASVVLKALSRKKEHRFKDSLDMSRALIKERNRISSDFSNIQLGNYLKKLFNEEIKKDSLIISQAEEQIPTSSPPVQSLGRSSASQNPRKEEDPIRKNKSKAVREIILSDVKESGLELDIDGVSSNIQSYTPTPFDVIQNTGINMARLQKEQRPTFKMLPVLFLFLFLFMIGGVLLLKDQNKFFSLKGLTEFKLIDKVKIIPASGRTLQIDSELTSLTVKIAGSVYVKENKEPLVIENLSHQSDYFLEISKPGFETITDIIKIQNNTKYILPIKSMVPLIASGSVFLDSSPRGAEIFLNGVSNSVTPVTVNIPVGRMVEVEFKRHGYNGRKINVMVSKEDELIKKIVTLDPVRKYAAGKVPAIFKIDSTPTGANVYIDSDFICRTPCVFKDGFINDVLNIDLIKKGYKKYFTAFPLKEVNNYINPILERNKEPYAFLTLTSSPPGLVYIDDEPTNVRTPMVNYKIKSGKSKISVKIQGKMSSREINVEPGEHIKIKMVRKR